MIWLKCDWNIQLDQIKDKRHDIIVIKIIFRALNIFTVLVRGGGGGCYVRISACIIKSKKDWTGQDRTGHRRTLADKSGQQNIPN